MWQFLLGGAVVVGIGKLVLDALEDDARSAARRYQSKSEEVLREVARHNCSIEKSLDKHNQSLEFHRLRDLHYASVKVANAAHRLLSDHRTVLNGVNKLLQKSGQQRDGLKRKISTATGTKKPALKQELGELFTYRKECFSSKEAMEDQGKVLLKKVKKLNRNTHRLKLEIRDHCGRGGSIWYQRLEARTGRG